MPYKQIAARLQISPSTAHSWTKDIELSPEQVERNRTGPGGPWNPDDIARRAYSWSKRCRNRRRQFQRNGRRRTLEGDPLHLAGCMLYWAEGSKGKNQVHFANSELDMLRLFKAFLVECFEVPDDRFSLTVNVYLNNGLTLADVHSYWLSGLELPPSCLRKPVVNHAPTSSSGGRRGKLPYGVGALKVLRSTAIVQHIFGAVQEYAGFERPAWVGRTERQARLLE